MNLFKIIKDIEKVDAEVYDRLDSRRGMFKSVGKWGGRMAAASVPFMLGGMFKKAYGQTSNNSAIIEILNYALTLEYLENEFYAMGLAASGLIPEDRKAIFQQIGQHEAAHVTFLKTAIQSLQGTPASKPTFDFTANGTYSDVFSNYQTFLALSQAFEDTGVRAYKGQAGNLISNNDVLTAALQIHSVEARHAAMVRRLRAQKGWINGKDSGGTVDDIYTGEDNTTQGGVNLTTLGYSAAAISQAFDEPLTKDQVLPVASLFIKS